MFDKNYESSRLNISLKGKVSKYKILQQLAQTLTILEEKYGIDDYSNVDLYFNMNINNDSGFFLVEKDNVNNKMKGLTVSVDPDDLRIFKNEKGEKVMSYDESHNYNLLRDIEDAKNQKLKCLDDYIPITRSQRKHLKDLEKKKQDEVNRAYKEKQKAEEYKRDLERKAEQKIIDDFELFLLNDNNLKTVRELRKITTSFSKIKSRSGMLKYLEEYIVNNNDFILKVKYRIGDFENSNKIIIYNANLEKLIEIKEEP